MWSCKFVRQWWRHERWMLQRELRLQWLLGECLQMRGVRRERGEEGRGGRDRGGGG